MSKLRAPIFVFLMLFYQQSFAFAGCGFKMSDATPERVDKSVPILVARNNFSQKLLSSISTRASLAKKSLTRYSKNKNSKCDSSMARVETIMSRVLGNSSLTSLGKGKAGLELVMDCTNKSDLPTARLVADKYILVNSPLALPRYSDGAIAAVIAHEIAHHSLAHTPRLISAINSMGASRPKARAPELAALKKIHELEADITGLKLLVNAGYSPTLAIKHLRNVQKMIRTKGQAARFHYSARKRSAALSAQIKSCDYPDASTLNTTSQVPI